MKARTLALSIALSFSALGSAQTLAADSERLLHIQKRWAEVNYTLQDDEQEKAFDMLVAEANAWIEKEPDNADAYVWRGIIQSTYAGAKGGLGALGLAKKARKSLEHALELDPDALDGSAYGSLGTLYYKVPGWPLGFGDDKKAGELLLKALAINPDGIDPNYFYADYLYEQGDYQGAKIAAEHALQAPPRPERPLADEKRRQEIQALMEKITTKVN
ncbi:tetratricopeptide repeat protein [Pseudidiomarina gelatinasegens]|uniref:tetratricopeptide repeat protein n=1 Tax=Pseudidiomarina gelatinasegens TaxID=2487740 RepID=UPI003A9850E6